MPDSVKYFPAIDGLRGVAVLAVFVFHLLPHAWPGGFVGVDVFFVISGFVLSHAQAGRPFSWPGVGGFFARRALRIQPALLACLWFSCAFIVFFTPATWLSELDVKMAWSAHFAYANFTAAAAAFDYFSPRADYNILLHTWSLAVEEQFYLLSPLLFLFLVGPRRRLGVPLLTGLVAASFSWALIRPGGFYFLPARFWEIGLGALAYQVGASGPSARLSGRHAHALAVGTLLLLAAGLAGARSDPWPGWGVVAAVGGAAGFLLLLRASPSLPAARLLTPRPLRWVGLISYSLYLFHWPVIVIFRWTCGLARFSELTAATALSFLLAALCYYFWESPFRRARGRWGAWQLLRGMMIVMGLSALALSYALENRQMFSLSVVMDHYSEWYPMLLPPARKDCNIRWKEIPEAGWQMQGAGACEAHAPLRRIFVIGDSHTGAYQLPLEALVLTEPFEALSFTRQHCGDMPLKATPHYNAGDCPAWERRIQGIIFQKAKPGDVLFLPALRIHRLIDERDQPVYALPRFTEAELAAAAAEAKRTLAPYLARGLKVVLEAPKPVFRASPIFCVDWYERNSPRCAPGLTISRSELLQYRQPVLEKIEKFARENPGVSVWDPFSLLCPPNAAGICPAMDHAHPLFVDDQHLSGYGSYRLKDDFVSYMKNL